MDYSDDEKQTRLDHIIHRMSSVLSKPEEVVTTHSRTYHGKGNISQACIKVRCRPS